MQTKDTESTILICGICKSDPKRKADVFCISCRDMFCSQCCKEFHKKNPEHDIVDAETRIEMQCGTCSKTRVSVYCKLCKIYACDVCCRSKHADNHFTVSAREHLQSQQTIADKNVPDIEGYCYAGSDEDNCFRDALGKPKADEITTNSLVINWSNPTKSSTIREYEYEVRGKVKHDKLWTYYETTYKTCSARIRDLKRNTEYVFQVRVVTDDDDHEFPWSKSSDGIKTKESAAYIFFSNAEHCKTISSANQTPQLGKLKFVEDSKDKVAKIRKLTFGGNVTACTEEKTILLVGETGSGKTTLVNRLINHIMCVDWSDEFRLCSVDLEEEEKQRTLDTSRSQTMWLTTYRFAPLKGRLKYILNVIDTPGFGDTERHECDIENQIKTLFKVENNLVLHAVCIVTKGSVNRLHQHQAKIFNDLQSVFGKDITDIIVVWTTHDIERDTPVLDVLKKANITFKEHFAFNNFPFSKTSKSAKESWKESTISFDSFFKRIETVTPCSMHITKELMHTIISAEHEIEFLTKKIREMLLNRRTHHSERDKLVACEKEMEAIKKSIDESASARDKYEKDIECSELDIQNIEKSMRDVLNKSSVNRTVYELIKHDLPAPDKALNCRKCLTTCAPNAGMAKYMFMWFSGSISIFGYCKRCGCITSEHDVDSFKYAFQERQVEETVSEMIKLYEDKAKEMVDKRSLFASCTAKVREIATRIMYQTEEVSTKKSHVETLSKLIKIYENDLQNMENEIKSAMEQLQDTFRKILEMQIKKQHSTLREYLESYFDDKEKKELLQELEPYL